MKHALEINDAEKEVIVLRAVWEIIDSCVNKGVFLFRHKDPDSSLMFQSSYEKRFFGIMLVDLLSKPASMFGQREKYIPSIITLCAKPNFDHKGTIRALKMATESFQRWLNESISYDHEIWPNGLWFPSINKEAKPDIIREDFLYVYGNATKHNFTRLDKLARIIQHSFKHCNIELSSTEALLVLKDLYDHFDENIIYYHASTIAEFMNNIIWGIYDYLLPEYERSHEWTNLDDPQWAYVNYKYNYPETIQNKYIQNVYWDLMNCIRRRPHLPRFQTTTSLKGSY